MYDLIPEIVTLKEKTEERLNKEVTPAKQAELSRKLDMNFDEWTAWQDAKSRAQVSGRISFETATFVYAALGSGPEAFNVQPLATKIVCTMLMSEILKPRA